MILQEYTSPCKPISQKLNFMLEEVKLAYDEVGNSKRHFRNIVHNACRQAILEGFPPVEAGKLIRQKLLNVSSRTISRYLPDECKDKYMQGIALRRKPLPTGDESLLGKQSTACVSSEDQEYSSVSEDRSESSDIFMKKLSAELDKRMNRHTIIDMEQLNGWLILSSAHSEYIFKTISTEMREGIFPVFLLAHDGSSITNVKILETEKRTDNKPM